MASHSKYQAPRGMRDFYPDDMLRRNVIFDAWREAALRFGFSQYDASVVESLDLLKRKAGEEIVTQIYDFEDKSGRQLALRPEMTPTLARMVASKQNALTFPLKWFAIAQCFRYERMTRGRKREHYQLNMDVVGEESISAEAEVIAAAICALNIMGLDSNDLKVHFSSRSLLGDLLSKLGISKEHHQAAFLALDKRGKIDDEKISELLHNEGVDSDTAKQVFNLLEITSLADVQAALEETTESLANVQLFIDALAKYGLEDYIKFDISVVRGLSYYTGIVFEAFDTAGQCRAVFGGGRYDNLLGDVGGKPATAVGLGFGDVVIDDILREKNGEDSSKEINTTAVGYMQEEQRDAAIAVACKLRAASTNVDLSLKPEKAKSFFGKADKSGYAKAVYIGPDDVEAGKVRVKTLATRTEEELSI
jgi:histidyl-tRNA synthetase